MQVLRVVTVAIMAIAMGGVPVLAQTSSVVSTPKELPPADFTGTQYVDSTGCIFIRAGVGGQTTWVPRMSRDRKQVCGQPPTVTAAAEAPAAPVAAATTAATDTATPTAAPVAAPAAAKPAMTARPAKAKQPAAPRGLRLVRSGTIARATTACETHAGDAHRFLLSDGSRVTRCSGEAPAGAVDYINGLGVPGLTVAPGAPTSGEVRRATALDKGQYRVVWQGDESRMKPAPTPAAAPAPMAAAPGGSYVQVGVFADPANAARTIAVLKSMGLPVSSALGHKAGQSVKAIMAGPFASAADQQAALARIRQQGYRDAYPRG